MGGSGGAWAPSAEGAARPARSVVPAAFAGLVLVAAGALGLAVGLVTAPDEPVDLPLGQAVASGLLQRSEGLLTEPEAGCVANGLVADLGPERMEELGMVDEPGSIPFRDMSAGEDMSFGQLTATCLEEAHLPAMLAERYIASGGSAEGRRCFADGFVAEYGPDVVRRVLPDLIAGTDAPLSELMGVPVEDEIDELNTACTPEEGGA